MFKLMFFFFFCFCFVFVQAARRNTTHSPIWYWQLYMGKCFSFFFLWVFFSLHDITAIIAGSTYDWMHFVLIHLDISHATFLGILTTNTMASRCQSFVRFNDSPSNAATSVAKIFICLLPRIHTTRIFYYRSTFFCCWSKIAKSMNPMSVHLWLVYT